MQSRVVWLMYMFEGVVLKLLWGKGMNFINEGFQSFPLLVVHWRTSAWWCLMQQWQSFIPSSVVLSFTSHRLNSFGRGVACCTSLSAVKSDRVQLVDCYLCVRCMFTSRLGQCAKSFTVCPGVGRQKDLLQCGIPFVSLCIQQLKTVCKVHLIKQAGDFLYLCSAFVGLLMIIHLSSL